MKTRLIIYLVLTLIAALIFMFAPPFNWGGKPLMSMYAQYIQEGRTLEMLGRVVILALIVFLGLVFLFGFKSGDK